MSVQDKNISIKKTGRPRMASSKNHHVAGATYYVILRGNADDPIFIDDVDRRSLKKITARSVWRHRIRVDAFAWTEREAHLIIQIVRASSFPTSSRASRLSTRVPSAGGTSDLDSSFGIRTAQPASTLSSHLPAILFHMHHVADPAWSSHRAYSGEDREPWINWVPTAWIVASSVITLNGRA
jgi:hypothetical protein